MSKSESCSGHMIGDHEVEMYVTGNQLGIHVTKC